MISNAEQGKEKNHFHLSLVSFNFDKMSFKYSFENWEGISGLGGDEGENWGVKKSKFDLMIFCLEVKWRK